MIEKMGHIKNPLTIIAIFAGIAEVSGTAVLPFLSPNNQGVFMWFVMIFPSVLVLLFFQTLWLKSEVLYGPADFRDDSSYLSLKLGRRVDDASTNDLGDPITPSAETTISFLKK